MLLLLLLVLMFFGFRWFLRRRLRGAGALPANLPTSHAFDGHRGGF